MLTSYSGSEVYHFGNYVGSNDPTPTSFIALETKVQLAMKMNAPQSRFFRGLTVERETIITCMIQHDDGSLERRINRLIRCSSAPRAMLFEDGSAGLSVGRCKDRMCPRCARTNAYQCSMKLSQIMRKMSSKRAITLTMKNGRGSLKEQINKLMGNWKEVRRANTWKDRVKGGVYSLEVTYNPSSKSWHPHLHLIVEGEYFPQKELSQLWQHITGDSPIVYIQAVHDSEKMGRYISKYVTKPDEVASWPSEILWEYMKAIKGRRLFHTFGTMHNIKLKDEHEKQKELPKFCLAPIHRLIEGNKAEISECVFLFAELANAPKRWRQAFGIRDLLGDNDNTHITDLDTVEVGRLLYEATKRLDRTYKPPRPPPIPILTLF